MDKFFICFNEASIEGDHRTVGSEIRSQLNWSLLGLVEWARRSQNLDEIWGEIKIELNQVNNEPFSRNSLFCSFERTLF